jgi:excisionase family DNA binding protein
MRVTTTDGPETTRLDGLLRPEEVARMLGVRRSSVYEYARTRMLPHVRIGRHVRFVRQDVEEWIKEQRRSDSK